MRLAWWIALVALLAAVVLVALGVGTMQLAPSAVWGAIFGDGDPTTVSVVRTLRLPRTLLAILVGAGLGLSGAALQGALRNTLAEPYLLGVSGGAAVGAVLAVGLGVSFTVLPFASFAGAAVAVALTLFVAHASGTRGDPRVLIMGGVVVGAFANAAIMIILANEPASTVRGALWWMMGSVADATMGNVGILALYLLVGGAALLVWARELDVLTLGDEAAAGLGVDVDGAMRRIFLAASLLAAATVAGAGLIGFVGLVVPHLARMAGARRHRPLLVASALIGAVLVVASDILARTVRPPAELPLGAVTAVLGVPFFLAKLRRLT
ncbi:MAG TPA: iron ABC transporter permease [Gemmatimonadaceae bacterium]|nr:iron ABC transporter permease [Gemmatimonadaceae bacterium]